MSSLDKITNSQDEPINQQPSSSSSQHSSPSEKHEQDPQDQEEKEKDDSKPVVKKRVRTGCLNCRRKHKKCDEVKPICTTCSQKNELCEWPNPKLKKSASKTDLFSSFNQFPPNIYPYRHSTQILSIPPIMQNNNSFPVNDLLQFKRQRLDASHQMLPNSVIPNQNQPQIPIAHGIPSNLPPNIQQLPPAFDRSSTLFDSAGGQRTQSQQAQQSEKPAYDAWKANISATSQNILSSAPTRQESKEVKLKEYILSGSAAFRESELVLQNYLNKYDVPLIIPALNLTPNLTPKEESMLLKYYIDSVSPQYDFLHVNSNVFRNVIVTLVKHSDALRYAIYALSLVHWEKSGTLKYYFKEEPLRLFQMGVSQFVKNSNIHSNAIRASTALFLVSFCLTVSEQSGWRTNVKALIAFNKSEDIRPVQREVVNFSLFWVASLLDVCTTDLMKEQTILTYDFESLRKFSLIPQIIAFISMTFNLLVLDDPQDNFDAEWEKLWIKVTQWGEQVEEEHIEFVQEIENSPFPDILCSCVCSVLANQLYYTTKILLSEDRPRAFRNKYQTSHPLAWYAKRICAINGGNLDLQNWISTPLCLSIAGKVLTHEDEHKEVLELLTDAQKRYGPLSVFRAHDLQDFWDGNAV